MNAFERFGFPPAPCVDAAAVKQRYLEQSAALHPDAGAEAASAPFAELNHDYKILLSDKLRLRHLLELCGVGDAGAIGAIPRHLGDLFMKAGTLLNASDRLLKARDQAESVLEKASLQPELLEKAEALQDFLPELLELRESLKERLEALHATWSADGERIQTLKELYQEFSYVEKWIEQVRETLFLLSE